MSDDLKDILSNSNKDIDNQKLMDYLSNKLSEAERHAFEKQMIDSDFVNDAVEGLQQMPDQHKILQLAENLNADLHRRLDKTHQRKLKRKIKEQPWIYFTIILILLLIVISYFIISRHLIS